MFGTKLTYEDYLQIPEDGKRHEIIDGEHYMSAAPRIWHQHVVGELHFELNSRLGRSGRARVLVSPVDVLLSPHDVLVPDLVVVRRERAEILHERYVRGAPDLVIEVLSPSTRARDLGIKRRIYGKHGVFEYWLVDIERREIEQLQLVEGGKYESCGMCSTTIEPHVFLGIEIPLEKVWPPQ